MRGPERFDLRLQPWLLARGPDGTTVERSLLDTLRTAHELHGLAGEVPTQVFALTRLLLAVIHRALGGTFDLGLWAKMWQERSLPVAQAEEYLARHHDRFDLFHPETPFFQVARLRTGKDEVFELNRLIADVPNGHPFFSTRLDRHISLSPAEAARWLVHCQAFDPSGIKSGAVGDSRVRNGKGYPIGTGWSGHLGGVLPEGETLLETLLLNLVPTTADDVPPWERRPDGPGSLEPAPTGPVSLFTWQSRRVRLVRDEGMVTGVLICNGDRLTPQNMSPFEPHTAWRRSQAQEKKHRSAHPIYMPLEHQPERLVWRGLQAMLPAPAPSQQQEAAGWLTPGVVEWISTVTNNGLVPRDYPVRLRTIGMTYGDQSSTTAEIIDDAMALQAVLLDRGAQDLKEIALACVRETESAAYAAGRLAANLAEAGGSRDSAGHRSRAVELAYAVLDPRFRDWLARLGPGDNALDRKIEWHSTVVSALRTLGEQLVAGASPQAWMGRIVDGKWRSTAHADRQFNLDLRKAVPLARQWEVPAGKAAQ